MSKPVLTRNTLQGMKEIEEVRLKKVNQVIDNIYNSVVGISKTSTNKSYKYYCNLPGAEATFFEDNKNDILNGLRALFPDSTIEFKFFLRDNNQQVKEFSVIDESMRQYVTRQYNNDYINIDWS